MWMAVPGRISAGRAGQAESALLPDTKVAKRGLSMPAISFSGCRRARLLGYNEGLTDLSKAPGLRSKCRKAANRKSWLRLSGQISANDKWRPAGFAVSAALGLDEGRA